MAYKRSYKRKTYKRRRAYRKTAKSDKYINSVATMAKEGFWLAKKLARIVNVEKKLHEVDFPSTSLGTGGILFPFTHNNASYPSNAISQGDGYNQRGGSSVKPLTLQVKGSIWTNSALTAGARLRIIIFKHKQENGQTIYPTTYLDTASVTSFKNWTNRFHFKTFYDKTFNLNANSNEIAGLNIFLKLFGHIEYALDSDTIENGALYMLIIPDASSAVNLAFNSRLTYVDN